MIMVGMRVRRGGKKVISLMINVSVVSTQDSSAHTLTQTHTHTELSVYLPRQTALFELSLGLKGIFNYTILPLFIALLCVLYPLLLSPQWCVSVRQCVVAV